MLNRKESEVMKAVFTLCGEQGRCLVPPIDILRLLPKKMHLQEVELEKILHALDIGGYIERLSTDRKGSKMFVLSLKEKGYIYKREQLEIKRTVFTKLLWSIISAVIAFFASLILRHFFS